MSIDTKLRAEILEHPETVHILHIPNRFPDSLIWDKEENDRIPKCCRDCLKHPSNLKHGDKISAEEVVTDMFKCNCSLPVLENWSELRQIAVIDPDIDETAFEKLNFVYLYY